MGHRQQLGVVRAGFVPPDQGARYFLMDEGRWTTYGEMVAGIEQDLVPADEDGLRLLLTAMGALSEPEVEAAQAVYGALLWAAARRVVDSVPQGVIEAGSFEEALPALREVLGRRGDALLGEVLARMARLLGEGERDAGE